MVNNEVIITELENFFQVDIAVDQNICRFNGCVQSPVLTLLKSDHKPEVYFFTPPNIASFEVTQFVAFTKF